MTTRGVFVGCEWVEAEGLIIPYSNIAYLRRGNTTDEKQVEHHYVDVFIKHTSAVTRVVGEDQVKLFLHEYLDWLDGTETDVDNAH